MADLANILWRAFTGSHAHLATGTDRIKRYARGFPRLIAYADPAMPPFDALAPYCASGERFYCAEWRGPEPAGWRIEVDTSVCVMLWQGAAPAADDAADVRRLREEHVPRMLALAALTKVGPFAERPLEIGEWYGIFDGEHLVAMAGERVRAGHLREISGVCTHPDYQGRGYAKRLTQRLVRAQLARGLHPFLHVVSTNARARSLYERMGFAVDREVPMRVVTLAGVTRA